MPIVVHLDDMLARRRMSLTDLARAVEITLANLPILKTGKAKAIRFSTLEAICAVLDCQPGDPLSSSPTIHSAAEHGLTAVARSVSDWLSAACSKKLP